MPKGEPNEIGPDMNDNEAAESPQMQQREMQQAPMAQPMPTPASPNRMPMRGAARASRPAPSARRHYKSGKGWAGGQ